MSEMSYLEKLLDGVEVEWKMLGEVIHSLKTGLNPRQNFSLNTLDAQGYYVTVREIQNGKVVFLDKTDRVNDRALKIINGRSNLEAGDILFSGTGTVGRIAVIEENPINWNIKEGVYTIKPIKEEIAPRFLSYLLQSSKIVKDYSKKIVGNPVISLPMGDLKKLLIPIPCPGNPEKSLAIQAEIVRILDKFTGLTAELTAELTMRKKQYNHYREQLLRFEKDEIEWKTLGEVAEYSKSRVSFDKLDKNNYVGVDNLLQNRAGKMQSNYVPTSGNLTEFREGDILIGNIRPYLKKIWQADSTGGTNGDVLVIRSCHKSILPRYLYQILADDNFFEYNMQHAKGAKMPRGNKDAIMKYRVPIPSFDEQTRIVTILDKFDTLTNSISEGLPREIELRQKQYEHYRDLLFSFPKPEAASN
ncbi:MULTISPECIES: restriction endonuclease subunit S [Enterobacteriaceae]|uniref:Restriction endonuclease subunit S n=1 Tax=Enterobacter cloacae TaxID=550 RepID=A0AA42U9M1_ENTCL|nr:MULTISPECIES: restriction endonuclease subunit S [Enterobacteriaceae]EEW1802569.1 restriction endonuclease subunit S [Escherichia coli]EIA2056696.1 restriction endonuclease subunit S [Escherichia coli]EJA4559528.1 restriction endonuclease subunit S [Escherichia coli]MCI5012172.1 restriction endonuclease subunit S [Escherichia coli]MDH0436861.1 restriction endonuclease subunit S [Enterobacter cloacae]